MATLFKEIFSAIRGRCISDESASVAAAEVAELVVKKFTSTNTGMDAIALWHEFVASTPTSAGVSEFLHRNASRINAVIAQQRHA